LQLCSTMCEQDHVIRIQQHLNQLLAHLYPHMGQSVSQP
jgi:hypothetical protein